MLLCQLATLSLMALPLMAQQESESTRDTEEKKPTAERRATLAQQESEGTNNAGEQKPTTERRAALAQQESEDTRTIILETRNQKHEPPVFFTARAQAEVSVGLDRVEQSIVLELNVIQGKAKTLSLGINGDGDVIAVQADGLRSWAVRSQGAERFLELHVNEDLSELKAEITLRSPKLTMPATLWLTHLTPGEAVGFNSIVSLSYAPGVESVVNIAQGFAPLSTSDGAMRFQSASGGQLQLSLNRNGALPAAVELVDTTLVGDAHSNGKSIHFQWKGQVRVSEPNAEITILSGQAAVSQFPSDANYRLRLDTGSDAPLYKLRFGEVGTFPVVLDFVVPLNRSDDNSHRIDFTVAASAVIPLTLQGLGSELEFQRDQESVVPVREEDVWHGFLPGTGRAKLQWKTARQAELGKLFFTTTGQVEAKVDAGLLRQEHQIEYQVLQGELKSLSLVLHGPGEILDVQGDNVVGWNVNVEGEARRLDITLGQPIVGTSQLSVRSQTPLDALPVRIEGMRLDPIGAIRHSGYVRLSNSGSVRLEPTALSGLTQLAPDQFPGQAIEARQLFVYRFPASEHTFTVAADRIQPEINISQVVQYEVTETDRVIKADIELDVREAAIREWEFSIPAEYSVVSVTGASVSDYMVASEFADNLRNLKIIFSQDVMGRQLVALHLEKSEAATQGDWVLPRIEYPAAKTVRGDIGIISAPGFRISVGGTDLLVEKPLAYFPKPSVNLQQAFRMREPGWSGTVLIEQLDGSVQADVFHLISLSQEAVHGSGLVNYFVTGSPVSQWKIFAPAALENLIVDGQDVRTWHREGDTLTVTLHQPVMGAYTLLVTFEEKPIKGKTSFQAGQLAPLDVQSERGYIQVVCATQVELTTTTISPEVLKLDPLELPAEFRLLNTAPPLGTWQYTERPFDLNLQVDWFQPGTTIAQIIEFSEANSRVSQDGELVTDIVYFVKSRGERTLKIRLPADPVRLWSVSVNGQPVTARQADEFTLIPLPGETDPNLPVEVGLRLGKPAVDESNPQLALPIVFAPVLKTQWNVVGDEKHILIPSGGTVTPPMPVLRPSGFVWLAQHGIVSLLLIGLLTSVGIWWSPKPNLLSLVGLLCLAVAIGLSIAAATTSLAQTGPPTPLQLSLPILSTGEAVELQVSNMPLWLVNVSWFGLGIFLVGIAFSVSSLFTPGLALRVFARCVGMLMIGLGVLFQGDAAPWFFTLLAIAILLMHFVPAVSDWLRRVSLKQGSQSEEANELDESKDTKFGGGLGPVTSALVLFALMLTTAETCLAESPAGFEAADSITQQWNISHRDARLTVSGTIKLSGTPGDRFLLLHAPAVLTRFEGKGLQLTKQTASAGEPLEGLGYIISIPASSTLAIAEAEQTDEELHSTAAMVEYEAKFEYQLEGVSPANGIAVVTGSAAVQEIDLSYDEAGWDVISPNAASVESTEDSEVTRAKVLLGPGRASLFLRPKARDISTEETQFFVEASNLYLPGPGVVDGRHRLHIRTSQGQVRELNVFVPSGLTVSGVTGPVDAWQFDADSSRLKLEIKSTTEQTFDVMIETQRGLDPLPADVSLAPLKVDDAGGEIGLLAIAFGPDSQPEKSESQQLSLVNLGDFDASLILNKQTVLHRVYRYGAAGGELALRVAPVDSEVRVASQQVLSLGDERVVLGVNFTAEIARAGLFQLSFPLPSGLDVESLTGSALHHWVELTEGDQRNIILHLNGKTIGSQSFSLTLAGAAPNASDDWEIPRFDLREAMRQTGELIVRPATGLRLRTVSRQNVSESDPRAMGGEAQGALAFRLLQRDWNLVLGMEQLDPWVTGQVLHEVTLREGQTRSALHASFTVQNASIRELQVVLSVTDEDEIKTLRASGDTVSDFVRTAPDSNIWEVQFKRRVVGKVQFRIEYERRVDRLGENETTRPVEFPQARQLAYYLGIRAGGRLELELDNMLGGWQRVDWGTVPAALRDSAIRSTPTFALQSVAPVDPIVVRVKRHALAEALKLRVAQALLTTVLSPTGDQLTAVDATIEVIQRSSLSVTLPDQGDLFSIFVNGESVNSIRLGGNTNTWQFNILPGIDDSQSQVRFVYSVPGDQLSSLKLTSPELNVPLENIQWNVIAPKGFELIDSDGSMELVRQTDQGTYDRDSYLSKVSGKRQAQAQQASQLLEQANQLLQAGEQTKARWALNSVANQYALDAASNEDARVQLENLQTQQAIVGLNTRRQRLYLDNNRSDTMMLDNQQLREAAADNPVLQQEQLNFRPQQLSELLRGNTIEDNAILGQIAARLVQHQRASQPAPRAILISLPEEGTTYTFSRTVQVAESQPLELDLDFGLQARLRPWQIAAVVSLLVILAFNVARRSAKVARRSAS